MTYYSLYRFHALFGPGSKRTLTHSIKKRVRNLLLQQHFHQFLWLFCFLLLLPNIWWKLMLIQSLAFAYIQLHSVSDYKKRLYKKHLVDLLLTKKRTQVHISALRNTICWKLYLLEQICFFVGPKLYLLSCNLIWLHYF